MRILLLTRQLPFPVRNGEDLRIFQLAKRLSAAHDLHVVAYREDEEPPSELKACFKAIHLIESDREIEKAPGFLKRFADAFRPSCVYPFDKNVVSLVQRLLRENHYNWLWIPSWQMIPYFVEVPGPRVLLDVMDDGVLELLRETRHSESAKQFVINLKRLIVTGLFEREYFARANGCCLVTDVDAEVLRRIVPSANVVTVPNGVDADYFAPMNFPEDYPSLIFEGNMSFVPSVDAMIYFCRDVFPLITAKAPEAKLWIVGRDPTSEVRNLHNERIIVTGTVDDVRPYLARASVFICPMRKGAGIKNKLLQAWAMGKPVVATSVGAGGLPAVHQKNVLIADDTHSFAREIICLLADPELRKTLGRNGRQTVLSKYTWDQQARYLQNWMSCH